MAYSERVVFEIQNYWHSKEGMLGIPVIDLCARMEDMIYTDTLKTFGFPITTPVWSKRECIIAYQESCNEVIRAFSTKTIVWKKLFEDNEKNPRAVLMALMKDGSKKSFKPASLDQDRLKKITSGRPPKASKSNTQLPDRTLSSSGAARTGIVTASPVGMLNSDLIDDARNEVDDNPFSPGAVGATLLDEVHLDEFGFDFDGDPDFNGNIDSDKINVGDWN